MIVGIVGVPPYEMMQKHLDAGDEIIDLDVPLDGFPVRDAYLPNSFCYILKTVTSNIHSLRAAGRLDLVIATTGEDKCDGMRYIANALTMFTDVPVMSVENTSAVNCGYPVSTSSLPLKNKMELIVNSVFAPLPPGLDLTPGAPRCGFWGVPPNDFSFLTIFPDDTHIYGWTRCMENKTPADLSLESFVDDDIPTVFFSQSFCQKSALAMSLAKKHGGLFIEIDKFATRSTVAKVEAFIEFSVNRK